MTTDQRQDLLEMARHKFGLYSETQLREEYKRKLFMGEYYIDDYPIALTKGELLALFETLISERRCKPTTHTAAETAGGTGTTQKTTQAPSAPSPDATATTSPSAKKEP